MNLVPLYYDFYGLFYTICLFLFVYSVVYFQTRKVESHLEWDIHFWLGTNTSQVLFCCCCCCLCVVSFIYIFLLSIFFVWLVNGQFENTKEFIGQELERTNITELITIYIGLISKVIFSTLQVSKNSGNCCNSHLLLT